MRKGTFGLVLGIGLVLVVIGLFDAPATAQRPTSQSFRNGLVAFHSQLPNGIQQITVIDSERRTMGVYYVDPQTGKISLRSVRNTQWDLLMDEYNGSSPTPREIRVLMDR